MNRAGRKSSAWKPVRVFFILDRMEVENALNELPIVRDPAADSTEREHHGTGRPCNTKSGIPKRQSSIVAPRIDHDRSWGNSNTYLQADINTPTSL
jgi:hypothetical protein